MTVRFVLWVAVFLSVPVGASWAQGQRPVVDVLEALVSVPGVSGREEAIRETILEHLPRWARDAAEVDAMGNLSVTVGSGEPWVLYVAHMDEIGYMVTHIRDDGRIQVQKHGGFYDRQYEGRLVQIHTASGPVNGVTIMPSTHLRRGLPEQTEDYTVESVLIDVGTESREETEALGIALLDPITVPKTLTRLAGTRVTARSLDDRFGCAALVAVVNRIQPGAVQGTVTWAWSAQEEVGLRGAQALAAELSPNVVIPVDTFVTSDSPLESKRVGYAELGTGPVIRALDQSNIAPIHLVRSLIAFAEGRGLRLTYGATMGGNDGSMFRNASSAVVPIGIPIRYSHTAVETIDGEDLGELADVLEAMARDASWAR